MMILIFSDSHNIITNMYKAINKHKNEIEVICHLGDGYADAQKLSEDYSDLTVHSVPGNCDFIN